jgi:hypothetical protein
LPLNKKASSFNRERHQLKVDVVWRKSTALKIDLLYLWHDFFTIKPFYESFNLHEAMGVQSLDRSQK